MSLQTSNKALVAPLDWGLGHTTRSIPIIKFLEKNGYQVFFAGNHIQCEIVKQEFPKISTYYIEGYNIKYSRKVNFAWSVLFQSHKILMAIIKENLWLKRHLKTNHYDLIISDNRYGFFTTKSKSIFITHQVFIKLYLGRFFDWLIFVVNSGFIKRYNELWIPDFKKGFTISGDLAHLKPINTPHQFIGTLSRLQKNHSQKIEFDFLILLSGPEPQRTVLEELILNSVENSNYSFALVRGTLSELKREKPTAINMVVNLADSNLLSDLIARSDKVICRSGYSTLMDLVKLEKCALLIPTPGQTEQIYLAKYLSQNSQFIWLDQKRVGEDFLKSLVILKENTQLAMNSEPIQIKL